MVLSQCAANTVFTSVIRNDGGADFKPVLGILSTDQHPPPPRGSFVLRLFLLFLRLFFFWFLVRRFNRPPPLGCRGSVFLWRLVELVWVQDGRAERENKIKNLECSVFLWIFCPKQTADSSVWIQMEKKYTLSNYIHYGKLAELTKEIQIITLRESVIKKNGILSIKIFT